MSNNIRDRSPSESNSSINNGSRDLEEARLLRIEEFESEAKYLQEQQFNQRPHANLQRMPRSITLDVDANESKTSQRRGGRFASMDMSSSRPYDAPPLLNHADSSAADLSKLPCDHLPELTRAMSRRARVWAARAKLNVALKRSKGKTRKGSSQKKELDVAKTSKQSEFLLEHENRSRNPMSLAVPSSAKNSNLFALDEWGHGSVIKKWWNRFSVAMMKYSFCVSGAALFAAVAGILYAANITVNDVKVGTIFLIFAGAFLLYLPAGILEDLVFFIVDQLQKLIPYVRNFQFVLNTLALKIRIIAVGTGVIIGLDWVPNLWDEDEWELLDIFASAAALWIIFDILIAAVAHQWNVSAHVQKLNEVIYCETVLRHLCLPTLAELTTADGISSPTHARKVEKKLVFKRVHERSSFHRFDSRVQYLQGAEMLLPLKRIDVKAPKMNFLSYEYSDQTFISLSTPAECRLASQVLFFRLDGGKTGVVTFSDWLRHFSNFKEAARAWNAVFGELRQNLKGIDEHSFNEAVVHVFQMRTDLAATIRDFQAISGVVQGILQAVFWVLLIVILLLIAGVSASKVLVTFSTVLVSGAVAFGNSLKNIIESLVFILYTKPYGVGDRIALGNPLGAPLTVTGIKVMTTSFVGLDNRVVIMSNTSLAGQAIYNLRRSKNANVEITFQIGFKTTGDQLKQLRQAVLEYLESHRLTKSRFDFYLKEVDRMTSVTLHIWFQTVYAWQEGFPINYVRSDVVAFTQNKMDVLGIKYVQPAQPIHLVAGAKLPVDLQENEGF